MAFRENLQYLRTERSLTQEQLATELNVSRQSVTKWEAGRAYPEMDKLIALCSLFGCTLDDLVMGDVTASGTRPQPGTGTQVPSGTASDSARPDGHEEEPFVETDAAAAPETGRNPVPDAASLTEPSPVAEETFAEYDRHMRKFASLMAMGCGSVLVGVTLLILISGTFELWRPSLEFLGLIPLFAGIGIGVYLFVTGGFSHSEFMRTHPVVKDFYSPEQRKTTVHLFTLCLCVGLAFIFVGVVACAMGEYKGEFTQVLSAAFMVACATVAVFLFVYGGIMLARLNVGNYNTARIETMADDGELYGVPYMDAQVIRETYTDDRIKAMLNVEDASEAEIERVRRQLETRARKNRLLGGINGCIMLVATIAGLTMRFVPAYENDLFWLSWVFGGICCGIVSLIVNNIMHD